jgi:peptidoglycan/LPS O-acetylase OafA/YrhL
MKFSKNKDFRKVVLTISLSFSVIAGVVVWLRHPETQLNPQELVMIVALSLVLIFALYLAFRRLRDVKQNLPADDELSKSIMRRTGATSYYVSLYVWLVLMMFEARIDLERSSLIGAGILGMAVVFALSWLYHRFIRPAA